MAKEEFDVQAFEEKLKEAAKDLIANPRHRRESAICEIGDKDMPNASFIVDTYPDFDGLIVRFMSKGRIEMHLYVSPQLLLEEEEVLHWASSTCKSWVDEFGASVEEV